MSEYNLSELVQQATTDVSGLDTVATMPTISLRKLVINKIREANPGANVNLEHLEYTLDSDAARRELGVSDSHDDFFNNGTEIRYFEHTRHMSYTDIRMVPEFVGRVPSGSRLYNAKTLIFKHNELPIGNVLKQILPNLKDVYSYDLYDDVRSRINRATSNVSEDLTDGVAMNDWNISENHRILVITTNTASISDYKSPVSIATGYHLIHFVREAVVKEDFSDINLNTLNVTGDDFLTEFTYIQN